MGLGFKLQVDEESTPSIKVPVVDVNILPIHEDSVIPEYKSKDAVGVDLHAYTNGAEVTIKPHETVFIGTGIKLEVPRGVGSFIFARSGMACKEDLAPANKVGIVDPDYRGEIMVALHNHGEQPRIVNHGDRIAQMAFIPYYIANFKKIDKITETERGDGSFGHSGK